MSVAAPPSSGAPGEGLAGGSSPPMDAACPLCGAPLEADQEWCLRCGAAARTRLAAPTNWKAPIVAIAVTVMLALGILAAALVKLTGGSGTSTALAPVTTTITRSTPSAVTPGLTGTATTPGAGPGGTAAPASPGAVSPGTPTTIKPSSPAIGTGTSANETTTTGTTTNGTATTGPRKIGGLPHTAEEALRKAGFLRRGGR